ncbi:MAG: hypothetical protein JXX14_04810 [Deltaproteobacteria bacterium]|nr:hypothetical protein [Deltaproteobacteria bacterium]
MNFERSASIKKGIAITVAVSTVGFVLFVLIRNDFAVNMDDLSGAVKKALGTRTVEEQQASILAQLDVTPAEVFKQRLKSGKIVTVVIGDIQNNSRYPMENVLVEGRLLDATKAVRQTTAPVPCGKSVSKSDLGKMTASRLNEIYQNGDQPFNCIIKSGFTVPFIVIFDSLPDSFNSTYEFEVHPHSGQFLE